MPYPQILFSEKTVLRFVDEDREELVDSFNEETDKTKIGPYLNKLPLNEYRDLFDTRQRQFTQLWHVERTSYAGLVTMVQRAGYSGREPPPSKISSLLVSGSRLSRDRLSVSK